MNQHNVKKLEKNKPIEVLELKEEWINLSWDIKLRINDDNLHNDYKPR